MRIEAEPSTSLRTYFGKCLEAKYKLPLSHLALHNYYGVNTGDLSEICDRDTMRSADFINCFGGNNSGPATVFVDETWKAIPDEKRKLFENFKRWRISDPAEQHAKIVASFSGLEEFYVVTGPLSGTHKGSVATPATESLVSPSSTPSSSFPSPSRTLEQANAHIAKLYLHAIISSHGHCMKKLLLDKTWALSGNQIAELVSGCPNLEQLGLGLSEDEPNAMRILAPFLKNVTSLRILHNDWLEKAMTMDEELREVMYGDGPEPFYWKIPPGSKIKWSGIGDQVFRVGKAVQIPDEDGRLEWKKEVYRATLDDVKHIEIWNMDRLEI